MIGSGFFHFLPWFLLPLLLVLAMLTCDTHQGLGYPGLLCVCCANPHWYSPGLLRAAVSVLSFLLDSTPRGEGLDFIPLCVSVVVPDTVGAQKVGAGGQK